MFRHYRKLINHFYLSSDKIFTTRIANQKKKKNTAVILIGKILNNPIKR